MKNIIIWFAIISALGAIMEIADGRPIGIVIENLASPIVMIAIFYFISKKMKTVIGKNGLPKNHNSSIHLKLNSNINQSYSSSSTNRNSSDMQLRSPNNQVPDATSTTSSKLVFTTPFSLFQSQDNQDEFLPILKNIPKNIDNVAQLIAPDVRSKIQIIGQLQQFKKVKKVKKLDAQSYELTIKFFDDSEHQYRVKSDGKQKIFSLERFS